MRLTGSGFPEGRPASVTLRGEVRRAGEVPRTDVVVSAEAEQVAPHALELPIDAELAAKLCGGASARHGTFRGDVEVSFSPQSASGLPVVGRLDGVVIDFVPVERDEASDAKRALRGDGARFARFLGITLGATAEGLQLTAVEPHGRAARANLAVGDVIQELDGMVVRGVADFIPPPNAKSSLVVMRRGSEPLALRVDSSGFRYSSPETLVPALVVFGALFATFMALCSPLGRWLTRFERRLSERLRSEPSAAGAKQAPSAARAFKALLGHQLPESFLPYLALVGACAVFSLLALSRSVIWTELDALLLPAVTLSGLCVCAFLAGDAAPWSLRSGLLRAVCVLLFNLPLALFILATASWAGSLRVSDVVGAQGPWPWQWAVCQSPVLGMLALMSLLSRVASVRASAELSRSLPNTARQRALELSAWAHTLCVTGLLALLGFGGAALPFTHVSAWAMALGVVLTLGKACGLLLFVAVLRWMFGSTDVVQSARGALLFLVLPSGLALAAGVVFAGLGRGPTFGTVAQALPATAFVTLLAISVWLGWRVFRGARTQTPELRIQSWL